MKIKAIIVDCKSNKEEVVHILSQLNGVKQVYPGGSKIAIVYDCDKEESIIRSIKPLSGVKNPTIASIEMETLPAVKIPGDREGWFTNGVKLPKDLTDKKIEEIALNASAEYSDDFCKTTDTSTIKSFVFSPVEIPNELENEEVDDIYLSNRKTPVL
jgi:hypothetical protein